MIKIQNRPIAVFSLAVTLLISVSACDHIPFVRERLIEEERQQTARTEEAIKGSSVLQELDKVCSDVPKPPNSQLITKRKSFNDKTYLTYGYYSDAPYSEMKGFYVNHFQQDGWTMMGNSSGMTSESIEFRKENYDVSVTYSTKGDGVNYILHCE